MALRKILFWIHLGAGTIAGIVILIMSFTGVLLAYERQIVSWVDRGYISAPPNPGAAQLPVGELLARACIAQHSAPSSVILRSDPVRPIEIGFGRDRTVYFNSYTGDAIGVASPKARNFFRTAEDWHRWLGVSGKNRALARSVTGICNLAFLILVSTGLFLWWPKSWSWRRFLAAVTWRWNQPAGRARDWNWHTVTGFWCAAPLMVIVLCAVIMSFPWANNLLYRMTGNTPPPAQQAPASAADIPANRPLENRSTRSGEREAASAQAADPCARWGSGSMNDLWDRAKRQVPGWQSITLRMSPTVGAPAVFSIDQGDGGRPDKRSQLTLDWKTGDVIRWKPFSSYNMGRRLRAWVRFSHTGEAGGLPGETIAALAAAGATLLVFTGLAMACRRFFFRSPQLPLQQVQNAGSAVLGEEFELGPPTRKDEAIGRHR